MNRLQKTEFDILREFVRVCDELGLTYYLVCGTALGAAKYQGFIPWDDDVDVALPREDYAIFCEKAQALLPEHLFLQNVHTDPQYPLIFSKLRDCTTTYVEKAYAKTDMNHGVYIDVFPLDGYPCEAASQKRIEKEKHRYALMRLCCLDVPLTWKTRLLVAVQKLCGVHRRPARLVARVERFMASCPTAQSAVWCNHGNWQGRLEYAPREQYGDGAWATFEGLRVRIPEQIDDYLTQKYGDWRADPPVDEQVGHHYYTVLDLDKPYTAHRVRLPRGGVAYRAP